MDTPPIGQLKDIADKVEDVEERHNQVVDVYADITAKRKDVHEEVVAELAVIRREFESLRESIRIRMVRAKQATLILSLLAQQEEVTPLRNRIDQQPYEQYVTTEWFVEQLRDVPPPKPPQSSRPQDPQS